MRSAAADGAAGSVVGAIAVISASCAIGCPCFTLVTQRPDLLAGVFVLIAPSCSNAYCPQRRNGFGPPRLMPTRPAFGVKPCMRPQLSPERQDDSSGRLGPATPCAVSWR